MNKVTLTLPFKMRESDEDWQTPWHIDDGDGWTIVKCRDENIARSIMAALDAAPACQSPDLGAGGAQERGGE